jgi:hypothetical protein
MSVADKLKTIAENVQKVYEAGKQAQYDDFWDGFQENGNRVNYQYGFATWGDQAFYPKYDIVLGTGYNGAYAFFDNRCADLAKRLEDCNVILDTSKCGDIYQMFAFYRGTRIPRIDCSSSMNYDRGAQYLFSNADNLETVDALVLQENTKLDYIFNNCTTLKSITIEGTIGQNLDMKTCTVLDKTSIISIINALSSTTSGKTVTLSLHAVDKAFEYYPAGYESELPPMNGSDSAEWKEWIGTKTNWTISLV